MRRTPPLNFSALREKPNDVVFVSAAEKLNHFLLRQYTILDAEEYPYFRSGNDRIIFDLQPVCQTWVQ